MPTISERLETATTTLEGLVDNTTGTGDMVLKTGAVIAPLSVNGNTITTGTGTLTLSTFTLTVAGTASVSGTNTGDQTASSLGLGPENSPTFTNLTLTGTFEMPGLSADVNGNLSVGNSINLAGRIFLLGGNLTTSGSSALTLTTTGTTNVTLPITGTLATLAGSESLTNKTLVSTVALTVNGRGYQVQGADIASAATLNLDAATGDSVDVTGTTPVSAVTLASGKSQLVRFTGVLTLTHSASLILPDSTNITTSAGDYILFQGYAGGIVRAVIYSMITVPAYAKPGFVRGISYGSWIQAVSGAGAATGTNEFGMYVSGPSTAVGYGLRYVGPFSTTAVSRGKGIGVIDWSKSIDIQGTILIYGTALHANCTASFVTGKTSADVATALARRGIGITVTGTGAVQIVAHDGTTLVPTATSFTPTLNQAFDVRLVSNGAGSVYCWINDVLVGTGTGGPTTDGGGTENLSMVEVENTGVTTTQGNITFSNFGIQYGR